jgi:hypothetical protein
MGGEYFVFLFHQGTEQPHQGDVNNIPSFLIHPRRYASGQNDPGRLVTLFFWCEACEVFTNFIVWS